MNLPLFYVSLAGRSCGVFPFSPGRFFRTPLGSDFPASNAFCCGCRSAANPCSRRAGLWPAVTVHSGDPKLRKALHNSLKGFPKGAQLFDLRDEPLANPIPLNDRLIGIRRNETLRLFGHGHPQFRMANRRRPGRTVSARTEGCQRQPQASDGNFHWHALSSCALVVFAHRQSILHA